MENPEPGTDSKYLIDFVYKPPVLEMIMKEQEKGDGQASATDTGEGEGLAQGGVDACC